MTKKDTEEVNANLSNAGRIFNKISGTTLRTLEANQSLAQTIETFNNTYVRKGQVIGNTKTHVEKLIKYIEQKFDSECPWNLDDVHIRRKQENGPDHRLRVCEPACISCQHPQANQQREIANQNGPIDRIDTEKPPRHEAPGEAS